MLTKEEVMIKCPKDITLEVSIPDEICCNDYASVSQYLWDTYHFEVDIDEDSDYFERIFYNNDLRSIMGLVLEWCPLTLYLYPQYYASDLDNPDDYWTKRWRLLIKNSIILED